MRHNNRSCCSKVTSVAWTPSRANGFPNIPYSGATGVCCVTVGSLPWARPWNTLISPVCTEYTVWNLVFAMTKTVYS